VIDESKTEYTKTNRSITNVEQILITDGQVFEGVQNFRCSGKVKLAVEHATKAQRGNRSIALLFL
jgi:hypothetical protein